MSLYFWWWDKFGSNQDYELHLGEPRNVQGGWQFVSAFSVAELGEMLPKDYEFETYRLPREKWVIEYVNGRKVLAMQLGDTKADARAKILIYLLENKLITLN